MYYEEMFIFLHFFYWLTYMRDIAMEYSKVKPKEIMTSKKANSWEQKTTLWNGKGQKNLRG